MARNRNESQIGRLLDTIDAEYQSAQSALTGPPVGTSKHEFITARMENIGAAHKQLVDIVGKDAAGVLLVEQMNRSGGKP